MKQSVGLPQQCNYYGDLPDNVFVSDQHDVEMMIVKAEGIERIINNYDADEHIAKFENQEMCCLLY